MDQPQVFSVVLTRPENSVSWGFRLQGGADFATPLSIQLVQPGSVAEQGGLAANDAVLQINGAATETMEHEKAKMEILRAGNQVEFLIARGAVNTWRPKVTPMSELRPEELQTHSLPGEAPVIQKTSLAANKQPVQHIGSAHNRSARPFQSAGGTEIVEERHISIRDSFPDSPAQRSHLSHSQLQEEYMADCSGVTPNVSYDHTGRPQPQPMSTGQAPMLHGVRSVQAPKTDPNTAGKHMTGPRWKQPTQSCYICHQPISGVFVRVKEHQLHSDCLRCAQCKRNLKNIGYIWVGDNIYCVQHARELTRPPGGGYTAYVIDAPPDQ